MPDAREIKYFQVMCLFFYLLFAHKRQSIRFKFILAFKTCDIYSECVFFARKVCFKLALKNFKND